MPLRIQFDLLILAAWSAWLALRSIGHWVGHACGPDGRERGRERRKIDKCM